jgi:hypothetical protein
LRTLDVMRSRARITIVGLLTAAAGFAAEPTNYVFVGDVPAVCPITINRSAVQLPPTFRITPEDAVRRAAAETSVKCDSIFEQLVYADSTNYYIIKSALGSMSDTIEAVVVDAATGKVSVRK